MNIKKSKIKSLPTKIGRFFLCLDLQPVCLNVNNYLHYNLHFLNKTIGRVLIHQHLLKN